MKTKDGFQVLHTPKTFKKAIENGWMSKEAKKKALEKFYSDK